MTLSVDIEKRLPTFHLQVAFDAGDETVGLLGASGCGKSMTLRCIAGVETPDAGRIVVNGVTFFDSVARIDLSPQQRRTALLFQNYQLFPNMTVAENIECGMDRSASREERHKHVGALLEFFHLRGFGKKYPAKLSGGQKQRVALARMLAAEPSILMLDEPFSALDGYLRACFEQELLDFFERFDGTIVYVSHDIEEAFRFCDRIAVIDEGSITDIGPTKRIVSDPQSLAAIRQSGCKNVSTARKIDEHTLFAENWGVELVSDKPVPDGLVYVGIRAFEIHPAGDEDTTNVFTAEAARVSDARFHRTVMLALNGDPASTDIEKFVHWKIDKLLVAECDLVERGDRLLIKLPSDHLHLVCR